MKAKKLFSGFLAASVAATVLAGLTITANATDDPSTGSTNGLESGVYLCRTTLSPGNFMCDDYSIYSEGEPIVGQEGCVAHFDDKGVLTLGGILTVNEARENNIWGAIGGVKGKADLAINLLPNADITLDSKSYSGIYGNYEPVKIQGNGKITINTSGESNGGILVYGGENAVPNGITITDGANVIIKGTKGILLTGGADGDITVTNGAVLTVETESNALSKVPVIQEGSTVMVGERADNATAWDGQTALTTYNYVQIQAPTEIQPTEEPKTWTGVRVGGADIYEEAPTWTNDGVTAAYDKATATLTLSGTGEINGPTGEDGYGFGGAIYATNALNIVVAKDADITLNAGAGKETWAYGIYTYSEGGDASLTIGGDGKLTINSLGGKENATAIGSYSRKVTANNGYDVTIKGNVEVTAKGSAYGIYTSQAVEESKQGWIQVTEKASLTVSGSTKAVYVKEFKESYIYGGGRSFEGSVNGGAWDESQVTSAKSLSIKPAVFEQWTSGAITGSDEKTGFVTTVNGKTGVTIKTIKWEITSGGEKKKLAPEAQPQITLGDGAQAVFAVIVNGLKDPDATAYAIIE